MPSKSKTKGAAFEREVAKAFSDAFGKPFTRSAQSGAWMGGKNASRDASESVKRDRTGDIVPPDGMAVVIECKRYAAIPDLMDGPSALIDGWLDQLCADWDSVGGALAVLVYKADRRPAMLMSRLNPMVGGNSLHYLRKEDDGPWYVYRLDEFLADETARFEFEAATEPCPVQGKLL